MIFDALEKLEYDIAAAGKNVEDKLDKWNGTSDSEEDKKQEEAYNRAVTLETNLEQQQKKEQNKLSKNKKLIINLLNPLNIISMNLKTDEGVS